MSRDASAEMGMNKTGMGTAPRLSKEMVQSSSEVAVSGNGGITAGDLRLAYIQQGAKVGSVPPPSSVKGMAKSALQALKGEKATVLIDKLAERLAFERSGTRLYEALMLKCNAFDGADRAATIAKLEHIYKEELEHFHMLWECLETLGADPTVQTPSADVAAVASQGIPKVLLDPRTTFAQCLEAIMTAELVDGDAWERLTELAEGFNQTEMAEQFRQATRHEKEHQVIIRELLRQETNGEAGISVT
ncbi:MAG TPA: ferritin-like domain-containing protein [Candidatus Binatia bacterium]|nr:ferritin-like domain-containing protein [Candidatus Binatia bacterium]